MGSDYYGNPPDDTSSCSRCGGTGHEYIEIPCENCGKPEPPPPLPHDVQKLLADVAAWMLEDFGARAARFKRDAGAREAGPDHAEWNHWVAGQRQPLIERLRKYTPFCPVTEDCISLPGHAGECDVDDPEVPF